MKIALILALVLVLIGAGLIVWAYRGFPGAENYDAMMPFFGGWACVLLGVVSGAVGLTMWALQR